MIVLWCVGDGCGAAVCSAACAGGAEVVVAEVLWLWLGERVWVVGQFGQFGENSLCPEY